MVLDGENHQLQWPQIKANLSISLKILWLKSDQALTSTIKYEMCQIKSDFMHIAMKLLNCLGSKLLLIFLKTISGPNNDFFTYGCLQ